MAVFVADFENHRFVTFRAVLHAVLDAAFPFVLAVKSPVVAGLGPFGLKLIGEAVVCRIGLDLAHVHNEAFGPCVDTGDSVVRFVADGGELG